MRPQPYTPTEVAELSRMMLRFGEPRPDDEMVRMIATVHDREEVTKWLLEQCYAHGRQEFVPYVTAQAKAKWPWLSEITLKSATDKAK